MNKSFRITTFALSAALLAQVSTISAMQFSQKISQEIHIKNHKMLVQTQMQEMWQKLEEKKKTLLAPFLDQNRLQDRFIDENDLINLADLLTNPETTILESNIIQAITNLTQEPLTNKILLQLEEKGIPTKDNKEQIEATIDRMQAIIYITYLIDIQESAKQAIYSWLKFLALANNSKYQTMPDHLENNVSNYLSLETIENESFAQRIELINQICIHINNCINSDIKDIVYTTSSANLRQDFITIAVLKRIFTENINITINIIQTNEQKKESYRTIQKEYELPTESYINEFKNRCKEIGVTTIYTHSLLHDYVQCARNNHWKAHILIFDTNLCKQPNAKYADMLKIYNNSDKEIAKAIIITSPHEKPEIYIHKNQLSDIDFESIKSSLDQAYAQNGTAKLMSTIKNNLPVNWQVEFAATGKHLIDLLGQKTLKQGGKVFYLNNNTIMQLSRAEITNDYYTYEPKEKIQMAQTHTQYPSFWKRHTWKLLGLGTAAALSTAAACWYYLKK